MSLSKNLNKGMGIARRHLYYKCETGNKNRRESNTEAKFRRVLSFLLYMRDILCCAKSDIIAIAIVILKPCGFSDILFATKLA